MPTVLAVQADESERLETLEWLSGLRVGIYSLMERAARQAADVIVDEVEDCEVLLNHDHVGTDRLRALARSVDVMVIGVRSAKHAATEYIEQQLGRDVRRVYPPGKGASSILAALKQVIVEPR